MTVSGTGVAVLDTVPAVTLTLAFALYLLLSRLLVAAAAYVIGWFCLAQGASAGATEHIAGLVVMASAVLALLGVGFWWSGACIRIVYIWAAREQTQCAVFDDLCVLDKGRRGHRPDAPGCTRSTTAAWPASSRTS